MLYDTICVREACRVWNQDGVDLIYEGISSGEGHIFVSILRLLAIDLSQKIGRRRADDNIIRLETA